MNPTTVTTPNELEIRVERIFDAPRAHVFSAWTDPKLIPEWWGDGTVVEEMDVRPGGTYRFRAAYGVVEEGAKAGFASVDALLQRLQMETHEHGHEDGYVGHERACKEGPMSAKKATQKSAKSTTATKKTSKGFTDEERAAMKERAKELKAEARASKNKAAGESDVLAKIAEMPGPDRALAKRLHEIVKASAPDLSPKTWYGMPAYANKDGKVVCYFTPASKFKERYATFGFNAAANLDEGAMWPTSFALKELTAAEEAKIGALVNKAVS